MIASPSSNDQKDLLLPSVGMKRASTFSVIDNSFRKRLRGRPSSFEYFEVDQLSLLSDRSNVVTDVIDSYKGTFKLVRLSRPKINDRSYAAEEFKRVELAFRRFINRDACFHITEIDVVLNPTLEGNYRKLREKYKRMPNFDLYEDKTPEGLEKRKRTLNCLAFELQNSSGGCQSSQIDPHNLNRADVAVLAWHGTKPQHIESICDKGFQNRSSVDCGWYGKGMYFTQLPCYGQYYIDQDNDNPHKAQMILSWVQMGRPYPVTDRSLEGKPVVEGYDSHYVLVKNNFDPVTETTQNLSDEIVLFNEAQVLPRYIVKYIYKTKNLMEDEANSLPFEQGQSFDSFSIPLSMSKNPFEDTIIGPFSTSDSSSPEVVPPSASSSSSVEPVDPVPIAPEVVTPSESVLVAQEPTMVDLPSTTEMPEAPVASATSSSSSTCVIC